MQNSAKTFARRKEDFICLHCGAHVAGNGYTDHCPECLWGRHVDKNPGDRLERCGGEMKPVSAECDRDGTFTIHYVCLKCGVRRRFKQAAGDSRQALEDLAGH
ncbi:RNHCP domain-containing protein [Candidatus Marsarchaeota archaeon]|nr:RNHCP domain-containing protein [Candidatus Marsarchaeota archaeon]MCL5099520.1 RNHCP domain-containing protein [Candidatus Marsarchaeota archaeon]